MIILTHAHSLDKEMTRIENMVSRKPKFSIDPSDEFSLLLIAVTVTHALGSIVNCKIKVYK